MKILFPIGIFHPATVGGPSSSLYWHTCYLSKRGVECNIVTTDLKIESKHGITLNSWLKNEAGNVIYCKTSNQKFPFRALWQTIAKIPQSDVVHYSSAYYSLTLFTVLLSVIFKKRIILSPRGEFYSNAIDSFLKKVAIKLYKLIHTKILFHATSHAELESIKKIIPDAKIIIQPNFANIKTYEKTEILSKDLIFLGIIYAVKKIENIIKALAISKNFLDSNSKFLIAGKPLVNRDEEYQKQLKALVSELGLKEKVVFIGEVFNSEKLEFLRKAYVLLLPSDSENFGNVVVEAMSQSTPAITSTGTPWSILKEKSAGWWISNDPDSIAKAIDEALQLNEEDYLEICRKSLALVYEKFHIEKSSQNIWLDVYRSS